MRITVPYRNFGRLVADCPFPDCSNAREITPGQEQFDCDPAPVGCGRSSWIRDTVAEGPAGVVTVDGQPVWTDADYRAEAEREHVAQYTDDQGKPPPWAN